MEENCFMTFKTLIVVKKLYHYLVQFWYSLAKVVPFVPGVPCTNTIKVVQLILLCKEKAYFGQKIVPVSLVWYSGTVW